MIAVVAPGARVQQRAARDAVLAVAAGDVTRAVCLQRAVRAADDHRGMARVEILDALGCALEVDLAAQLDERRDQVAHEVLLRIHRVDLAATEAVVVQLELDPVAAEGARGVPLRVSPQTVRETVLVEDADGVGGEEARPRPALDVRAALALEDRAVDPGASEQAADHEAGRPRPDDQYANAHWRLAIAPTGRRYLDHAARTTQFWVFTRTSRTSAAAARVLGRLQRRHLGQPRPQPLAQLVGLVLHVRAALARDDDAGRGDAGHTGQADVLPGDAHRLRRLRACPRHHPA